MRRLLVFFMLLSFRLSSSLVHYSTAKDMTRQCVWIVRYGKTEFPLVENKGPYDSDIDPTEGLEHAKCIAQRIANSPDAPAVVYASPFQRTTHTGHLIASACSNNNAVVVRVEEGLSEWQTPSLLMDEKGILTKPRTSQELKELYDTVDTSYPSVNAFCGGHDFVEESQQDLLKRCAKTMQAILKQHQDETNIAIVSHAPCDQAIAYHLSGRDDASMQPWAMGGLTMFSRQDSSNSKDWKMELYSDTQHMPGEYKGGLNKWSLPMFDKGSDS